MTVMLAKVARGGAYGAGLLAGVIVMRFCWSHGANIPQGMTIALAVGFVVWLLLTAAIDASARP